MPPSALPLKRPGLRKSGNITLKRGIVQGDNELYRWFAFVGRTTVERRPLTIELLNDEMQPVVTWSIAEAWPVKCEGPSLKATGNDIAIESIELAHEGIKIIE